MSSHCLNRCEALSSTSLMRTAAASPDRRLPRPGSFSLFSSRRNGSFSSLNLHSCRHRRQIRHSKGCIKSAVVRCSSAESSEAAVEAKVVGKRSDFKKIMILGAGPIVIGQACEFDYSGTQACKALKEEGYEVVLINSNPATIMTDPELADRTYVAPLTPEVVERIIEKERPDALLPTMGGQTALNLAVALAENGALDKYNVELIGAKLEAIKKAEDRDLFKQAMKNIGIKTPPSGIGTTLDECIQIAQDIGEFPLIIRPAFTLGGTGGGIAYNKEEFESICKAGLNASLTTQVLVEKSLLGWKEYELEVMRDLADNVVIICSIENIDAMGVHTGDSITVAPAQTLTDKEYQRLRDYSIKIIREIGVECGGSNVQFAVNPVDGEVMVIEMNPRVSRSSALASKATGFPIAKMAAKLSVGYSLDQIPNDITKKTPASFEPSIDYVVTKIPRFAFEKFPGSQPILTTQMKSVGEDMAMGRTFQESFQKAVRGLECGYPGWGCSRIKELEWDWDRLKYNLRVPNPNRIHSVYAAMKKSYIDKWFLTQLKELVDVEQYLISKSLSDLTKDDLYEVKKRGFKFEADTPYLYSSYDSECEATPTSRKKVLILGGGPNRIDYDTSDRLYFEPLTVEDVLNVIDLERPDGIIVQFGGQTPLKLALPIQQYLDENKPMAAKDRERFNAILKELQIEQPKGGIAKSEADALSIASEIGYPVVVRPSYVLGGRAMEIVYSDEKLITYLENAVEVDPEIDIDALADSNGNVVIGGIMEHIEQAGVHSGDSACILPTQTISSSCLATIRTWTEKLAKRINVCGLMNCQYAITAAGDVFLLEANPRASRTVPFVSKTIGHPLAKYAALVMSGKSLHDLGFTKEVIPSHVAFAGCDVLLGPEMRSTGEVMGIDFQVAVAFAKAQLAAGQKLPLSGTVFLSLNDLTKPHLERLAKAFIELGFRIIATSGSAHFLELKGIPVERVLKMHEGRPHAGDMLANGDIHLVVITSSGDALDQIDGRQLRRMALAYKVPIITTVAGALATADAIKSLASRPFDVMPLQDFFDVELLEQRSKKLQSASISL
ncbi:unnamed protein product [Linum tenue]|uniref:Carbamoyl-phosphate synthase (glutamine-hydrolyzing) n=1 Tax=Linum tenue TaxID=586396 RepID=A0AAV0QT14_9ROSI|nr:unnamed protein product [Linum tenue]